MRKTLSAALALAVALPAGMAVLPAQAATRPTIARLADVNLNLGMTSRVTVPATGATSYEWQVWRPSTGWKRWAVGGTGYRTISLTGQDRVHMALVRVVARNAAGSTTSNTARIRVWGGSSDYPAAPGSTVKLYDMWLITAQRPTWNAARRQVEVKATMTNISAKPWNLSDMEAYYLEKDIVDQGHIVQPGRLWFAWTQGCDVDVTPLHLSGLVAAGGSRTGTMCLASESTTYAPGSLAGGAVSIREGAPEVPVAWFRGL